MRALLELGRALSRPLDLEELFRAVYLATSRVVDTTGFILGLYNPSTQTIDIVKQVESGRELPGGSFPLGGGFTSQVVRPGEPLLIRRWSEAGSRFERRAATSTLSTRVTSSWRRTARRISG